MSRCRGLRTIAGLAVGIGWAWAATAEPPEHVDASPPPVGLDQLLRLPQETDPLSQPEVGGLGRKDWEAKFSDSRGAVATARRQLAESQRQLEALASSSDNWQLAAPGATPTAENAPISYKLTQEIRRGREDVERAERRLQELEIEANLAGVPQDWRSPEVADSAAAPGS